MLQVETKFKPRSFFGTMSGFIGCTGLIFCALIAFFIAWFFPWVLVLRMGFLVYFPYEPDGESRYMSATGPVLGVFSDSLWTPHTAIPQACRSALVASEDTKFFSHAGVDFESIEKSYQFNKKKKKIKRGGSTITQQIVKNAFLSRDRSYVRKAREIAGALLLDVILSKEEQLDWYFNLVEFGPHTYGIRDAAEKYFNKLPQNLTPSQCVTLVSILPGPNKWGKSLARKNLSPFLQSRYRTILSRMIVMGLTPSRDIASARAKSPFGRELPARAVPALRAASKVPLDVDDIEDEEDEDGDSEVSSELSQQNKETIERAKDEESAGAGMAQP